MTRPPPVCLLRTLPLTIPGDVGPSLNSIGPSLNGFPATAPEPPSQSAMQGALAFALGFVAGSDQQLDCVSTPPPATRLRRSSHQWPEDRQASCPLPIPLSYPRGCRPSSSCSSLPGTEASVLLLLSRKTVGRGSPPPLSWFQPRPSSAPYRRRASRACRAEIGTRTGREGVMPQNPVIWRGVRASHRSATEGK
jgi:hypothetical protein